jgi:hypothetical protein
VNEQKFPGADGTARVRVSCVLLSVPDKVPVAVRDCASSVLNETVIDPVTFAPVCAATHRMVHEFERPGNGLPLKVFANGPNVPVHVPDKLRVGDGAEEAPWQPATHRRPMSAVKTFVDTAAPVVGHVDQIHVGWRV